MLRLNNVDNCKTLSPTNDYCIECVTGYFLSNEKKCELFPTGIYGCTEYTDKNTCTKCRKQMYLFNNACIAVDQSDKLPHCSYYESPKVCKKCEFNYYLTNEGNCVKAKALNCAEYKSIDSCSACPKNFGFFEDPLTSYVNCLHISTPNCEVTELEYPFKCIKCNKLFYVDEGKCLSNTTFIPHCEDYESASTCAKCDDDFILSWDRRRCMSGDQFGIEPYPDCSNNLETRRPVCAACSFGYQFYKGNCIQCKKFTLGKGCLYCEGID